MTKTTTFERIRKIIVEQLDVDPRRVTPSFSIADQMAVDSLDMIEIVLAFETEFDVILADEEARSLNTAQEMVAFIDQRLAGSS